MTKKSKHSCPQCAGQNLKARITTYPVKLGDKQINVGRVSVRECLDCSAVMPTVAGEVKIAIMVTAFHSMLGW